MNYSFIVILYKIGIVVMGCSISLWQLYNNYFQQFFLTFPSQNTYDYIVVGGGSAGIVMAGRLSEKGASVLLLEAGGFPPKLATFGMLDVPIFGPLWQRTALDWSYKTEPQSGACQGLNNKVSLWPLGRVLGGSAYLNNMVYLRGHYKDWEKWNIPFSEMLHYFMKSERQEGLYKNSSHYHSCSGWLPVSDIAMKTNFSEAILSAAEELNYFIGDLNTMQNAGFMLTQQTSHLGKRFTVDKAFLQARQTEKLKVLTNAVVNQVLFHKSNTLKASGVSFYSGNSQYSVYSRRGVVLSAGTIGSPKILLQSGIGPPNHLKHIGIDIHVPLANVGKNLKDHISTAVDILLFNTTLPTSLSNLINPKTWIEYFSSGEGIWSHGGCEVIGLLHSKFSNPSTDPPDIQLMVLPAGLMEDGGVHIKHNLGISDEACKSFFASVQNVKGAISATVLVVLLHPESHGEVKLNSKNPFDVPIIEPRYFSKERDIDTLVDGIYKVKHLLKTEAMMKIGAQINPSHMPGCENYLLDSYEYWKCYVSRISLTTYHPVGTCQMKSSSFQTSAVVDRTHRVYGTEKLFVVDASVFPDIPSANIHASIIAISERAADILDFIEKTVYPANSLKRFIFIIGEFVDNKLFCPMG